MEKCVITHIIWGKVKASVWRADALNFLNITKEPKEESKNVSLSGLFAYQGIA